VAYFAQPSNNARQILRNSAETIQITAYSDETATAADGSVTIGIVDAAGTTVVAAGTSTTSAPTGVYQYSLAAQSDLKDLTATWSGTWGSAMSFTTFHQVVGNWYTSPAEVRAMDSLSGEASTFPTADLLDAIQWAENIVEDYCGTNWVQRFQRDVLSGSGTQRLKLSKLFPTKILAASIDGTALTAPQIAKIALYQTGEIVWEDDTWDYNEPGLKVIVDYEHGLADKTGPPNDIRWAVRTLTRFHILDQISRIPDRALSISSEFGQIILAQPSMDRPTPLPDVNVVLSRHRHRAPIAF
jgi:hypothetical protein